MRSRESIESDVIKSAVLLDSFLRGMVGPTADWPLDIVTRDESVAGEAASLLEGLSSAVREYTALPASTP